MSPGGEAVPCCDGGAGQQTLTDLTARQARVSPNLQGHAQISLTLGQ